MKIPDRLALLSLFECEPKLLDENVPFFYNDIIYEFSNYNNERFVVSICPSYSDIKIQVYIVENNELLSTLNFKNVDSIEILADRKDESKIMIKIKNGSIKINFKPRFKVFIDFENYT